MVVRRLVSRKRVREGGFNLLELAIAMAIILTILLGVMASISTASIAEMNASEGMASQLLMSQTLEEIKNTTDFAALLSFNGQTVTSGTNTATIRAQALTTGLVEIQVSVASSTYPNVASQGVLLIANTQ